MLYLQDDSLFTLAQRLTAFCHFILKLRFVILIALLTQSLPTFSQTDSCKVFIDQFSDHVKANESKKAAIALSHYADCYQHKVSSLVEQDSVLLFWFISASLYDTAKEKELARQYWQRVFSYYDANPNPVFLDNYLRSLSGQIQQYFLASRTAECLQLGQKLYNIPLAQLQAAKMKSLFSYTSGLQYIGVLLRREGRLAVAEQYVNRQITVLKALHVKEDQYEFKKVLFALADTKQDMGDFSEAERIFQQLYDQLQKPDKQSELDWASDLAMIQGSRLSQIKKNMGQAEQRELLVRQCLKQIDPILLRYSVPDSTKARKTSSYNVLLKMHGGLLGELASAVEDRGMPEESLSLYLKGLDEISSTAFAMTDGRHTSDYVITLGNVGFNYAKLGKYAEAGEYLRQSQAAADSVLRKGSFNFAQSQLQIYSSEWGRRQGQIALDKCREALSHPEVRKNQAYPLMLSNYAVVQLANRQYRQADSTLSVAWANAKEKFPEVSEMTQLIISKKLSTAINLHHFQTADSLFEKHFAINNTLLLNRFLGLTETEKQRLVERTGLRNLFATYILQRHQENPGLIGKLYNQQLDYKGLLLWSSRKVQTSIRQSRDTSLQAVFTTYQRIRQQLSVVSALTEQQRRGLRVDSLETLANSLEKELSIRTPSFAAQRAHYTWEDVQQSLKPAEAALEIVRFQTYNFDSTGRITDTVRYAALLIKPGMTHPQLILLPAGNQMEKQWLTHWQTSIQLRRPDKQSYSRYWKSIAQALNGVKRLYFSPDGVYHQLNPATFLNPLSGRYVLEELDLVLLTSTRQLSQTQPALRAEANALLVGFPTYNLSADRHRQLLQTDALTYNAPGGYTRPALTRGNSWQPLPGTKLEVEQIAVLLARNQYKVTTLLGDDALEERLKLIRNPAILHMATHAFFEADSSRRLLGSRNPMLRAGLVLAGAQQRDTTLASLAKTESTDDGILTALEASDLTLDSTRLVVLSACQTGLGVVRTSEGVYGLQRAFRMAGAHSLLMSLWKVSDTSTQQLMTTFYKNWLSGQAQTSALRQAQQAMRQQPRYASPYYWGAFVLVR